MKTIVISLITIIIFCSNAFGGDLEKRIKALEETLRRQEQTIKEQQEGVRPLFLLTY